jgi:membrane-associated phospholipid phosphatase
MVRSFPHMRPLLLNGGRRQIALFLFAYLLYSLGRWVTIGDLDTAKTHAHAITDLEADLHVNWESDVQRALSGTAVLWLLNHLYLAAQLIVVPGALVWLFRHAPTAYLQLRNTVLATWLLSLPVYALFPVAPPRLADIGMVDTITTQTGLALDSKLTTAFYNPLAAVPSLHCGFAFAVGMALASAVRRPVAKALALLWGPLVGLAVVATGNHFVFDIAAGLLASAAGYGIGLIALSRCGRQAGQTGRGPLRTAPAAA